MSEMGGQIGMHDMPDGPDQELMPEDDNVERIKQVLTAQHAMHGMLAEVFEDIGGQVALTEYAAENQRWFYSSFFKLTPTLAPTVGMQGDINLTINNHLTRTALDD